MAGTSQNSDGSDGARGAGLSSWVGSVDHVPATALSRDAQIREEEIGRSARREGSLQVSKLSTSKMNLQAPDWTCGQRGALLKTNNPEFVAKKCRNDSSGFA